MVAMSGGCQCGQVRFRAEIDPDEAYACHCKMCRKATGGAWTAFVNAPQSSVEWEHEPDWYQSSPIAHRPFCARCGTPLGFAFLDGENIDLTIGSFDEPDAFRPTLNYAAESILPAWLDLHALPSKRSEENEGVVKRWQAAGLEVPE